MHQWIIPFLIYFLTKELIKNYNTEDERDTRHINTEKTLLPVTMIMTTAN